MKRVLIIGWLLAATAAIIAPWLGGHIYRWELTIWQGIAVAFFALFWWTHTQLGNRP